MLLNECYNWTHWDLNPGPSACEADVIPLHHVPSGNTCVMKTVVAFNVLSLSKTKNE